MIHSMKPLWLEVSHIKLWGGIGSLIAEKTYKLFILFSILSALARNKILMTFKSSVDGSIWSQNKSYDSFLS